MPFELKNTVKRSLQALQSVQKEMQEEYAVMRKAKEQEKQKVMEERKQLELEYQQSQNQLGQQKALLNSLCAETEKLVNTHKHRHIYIHKKTH